MSGCTLPPTMHTSNCISGKYARSESRYSNACEQLSHTIVSLGRFSSIIRARSATRLPPFWRSSRDELTEHGSLMDPGSVTNQGGSRARDHLTERDGGAACSVRAVLSCADVPGLSVGAGRMDALSGSADDRGGGAGGGGGGRAPHLGVPSVLHACDVEP